MTDIRPMAKYERPGVEIVVRAAFEGGDDEVGIVEDVWSSPGYVPELDLVAVEAQSAAILGHALFSVGELAGRPVAALAPLAVYPTHQGQGIGGALVTEGLRRAGNAGFPAMIVLGHPGYYPRFGFEPAIPLGIEQTMRASLRDEAACMVCPLDGFDDRCRGLFRYAWERP